MSKLHPKKPKPNVYTGPLGKKVKTSEGEAQKLFDKVAEECLHGDREVFDGLAPHERELVIQWMSDALVDGTADNAVSQTLWEVDYVRKPVDIETFLKDPQYFGRSCAELYPCWVNDLKNIFSPDSKISEWISTGGIGTGKSSSATGGLGYKLYQMSCLRDPAAYYGLLPGSKIVFSAYSLTKFQASDAVFYKLRGYIDASPYFRQVFRRDTSIESVLRFHGSNMEVIFGSRESHAIGMDLFSVILDEANYMQAKYDKKLAEEVGQAKKLFAAVSTRITSRFMRPGGMVPGLAILLSSRKTATDFTDQRIKLASGKQGKVTGFASETVYVSDYALWEVKPKRAYPGKKFWVEIGDRTHKSRILKDGEEPAKGVRAVAVPGDFRLSFEQDVDQSLRDIAGVGTHGLHPLIHDRKSLYDAHRPHLQHPFTRESVRIAEDGPDSDVLIQDFYKLSTVCEIRNSVWRPKLNPEAPRFIHVDLALTGDCAGIGCAHPSGVVKTTTTNADGTNSVDLRPFVIVDFMLRIIPPPSSQIDLSKIRSFILYLRQFFKIPVVTADGFQSADFCQILRKQQIDARVLSVDRTDAPYLSLRAAFSERRIATYPYEPFLTEMLFLERDLAKRKVDHPKQFPDGRPGCFSGDTLVQLLDGRSVPIRELAEKDDGTPIYLYTLRDGKVSVGKAVRPRLTKRQAETVIVTLDNGREITCTPDHRFMMRDGNYARADRLKCGTSLMPLYRRISKRPKDELIGYEMYRCPSDLAWHYTHRMVGKWKHPGVYTGNQQGAGVMHHKKGKRNNDPRQLLLMDPIEHLRIHGDDIRLRRADPVFEEKRRVAAVAYARSEEGREFSRQNMRRLHVRPEFRAVQRVRASVLGKRTGSINITKYNKSDAHRAKAAEIGRVTVWKAIAASRGPRPLSQGVNSHHYRHDVTVDRIKDFAADGSSQVEVARRLGCTRKVVSRALFESGTSWRAVSKCKRQGFASMTLERRRAVSANGQQAWRDQKAQNHKVVSVRSGPIIDVYDLSVPGTQNFALSAGVFVHNSKDTSDGICGAVWNCLTERAALTGPTIEEVDIAVAAGDVPRSDTVSRIIDPNKPAGGGVVTPSNRRLDWDSLRRNIKGR